MNDEKIFKVTAGQGKERLDKFLSHQLENISRTKIQDIISLNHVLVNDKPAKAKYLINPNDIIKVILIKSKPHSEARPENLPIDIIYQDDYLLIVNKQAGMVTHPAYGNYQGTLVNALLYHIKSLSDSGEPERPGIVHRIDKGTSGLLVIAKNDFVHSDLSKQFHSHTIEREYHAIVWGRFSSKKNQKTSGTIETYLSRSKKDRKKIAVSNQGKSAITNYEVIEEFNNFTYLKLNLKTGRTHQIRVHLAHINHPVFGDPEYGGRKIVSGNMTSKYKAFINNLLDISPFQVLHAKTLGFIHPVTKKMVRFDSELPDGFVEILSKIRKTDHFSSI